MALSLTQDPALFLLAIVLAVAPSLVWLFFYLKEDIHPEPRFWLLIIFLLGVASAPLVIFLETILVNWIGARAVNFGIQTSAFLLYLVAPAVEEIVKYGIVHLTLNKNPVLDEPADGMIYLIASALGFAAIENVIAVFAVIPPVVPEIIGQTINFVSLRFISAVALHSFASAIAGYFFALYYFKNRNPRLIVGGLAFAVLLHSVYNFLIIRIDNPQALLAVGVILGAAAALVLFLFNRLKYHTAYSAVDVDKT